MGEEFYCILKLVSGEEILSVVCIDESYEDPIVLLHNPIQINVIHSNGNSYMKVKPWMELCDDDIFIMRMDKIITMTETSNEKLISLYKNYISDDNIDVYKPTGKVEVSSEMGYLSSVEAARKKLENIFKGIKGT